MTWKWFWWNPCGKAETWTCDYWICSQTCNWLHYWALGMKIRNKIIHVVGQYDNDDPDQLVHPCQPIRAFIDWLQGCCIFQNISTDWLQVYCIFQNISTNSKGPNQCTVQFDLSHYYRILPNYPHCAFRTFKITGKTCSKISTKKEKKMTSWDDYLIFMPYFFLIFFIKAYVVGTHLNCLDLSRQFKWVPTTYAFRKKQIKVHKL